MCDTPIASVLLRLARRLPSCRNDDTEVEGPFPLACVDGDGSQRLRSFDLVSVEDVRLKVFVKGAGADALLAAVTARCAPQVRKVIERGVAHGSSSSSSSRSRSSCASSYTAPLRRLPCRRRRRRRRRALLQAQALRRRAPPSSRSLGLQRPSQMREAATPCQ